MKRRAASASRTLPPFVGADPRRVKASALRRLNLTCTNRQRARRLDLRLLERIVRTLLGELLRMSQADLGIGFVTPAEMARLNGVFRRQAGPTDVLAFDYTDNPAAGGALTADGAKGVTRPRLRGEVLVCVEEAIAQARRYRTAWPVEVLRCLVHGVLHLRGLDDGTPRARRRMKAEEDRLLGALERRFSLSHWARSR